MAIYCYLRNSTDLCHLIQVLRDSNPKTHCQVDLFNIQLRGISGMPETVNKFHRVAVTMCGAWAPRGCDESQRSLEPQGFWPQLCRHPQAAQVRTCPASRRAVPGLHARSSLGTALHEPSSHTRWRGGVGVGGGRQHQSQAGRRSQEANSYCSISNYMAFSRGGFLTGWGGTLRESCVFSFEQLFHFDLMPTANHARDFLLGCQKAVRFLP